MLKRKMIRRILTSSAALFACLLVYLIPTNESGIDVSVNNVLNYEIKKSNVYLLDDNNMLGRTSVVINSDNPIDISEELLEVLIKGGKGESKIPNGFRALIPSDTNVNGIVYDHGIMKVDFSNDLFDIVPYMEMPMIEAITYTLTELDDVEGVVITVDGNTISRLPNSNLVIPKYLDRKIGINKEYDITSLSGITSVTEYYVSKHNDNYYYVPVTKYVNDEREKIKIIIEDLTSSNTYMSNLISYINSNTKLLKTNIENDIMELTFNNYILNDFNSNDILEEVIDTISLSIKENYDVKEVVFYVNDDEICKSVIKTIE